MNPETEDEFFSARDAILANLADWARDRHLEVGDVQLLLDFKWNYADGRLARWRVADVETFLHDWYPRKVLADPEDAPRVTAALAGFFEYLADEQLLEKRSATVEKLNASLAEHEACLADALAHPEKRGPAAAIAAAMTADGVDLTDEDAVQAWIQEFNEGPIERRDEILGWDDEPPPPTLVVRHAPAEDELRASAAAAPILDLLDRFAGYVGDGRDLTQTGNLKLADARELVDLLETGESLQTTIGDRTFQKQSAAYLRRLDLIFNWAKRARVVRVARGRLYATRTWTELRRDPAAALDRATDVILENGPLEAWYGYWGSEADWNVIDELLPFVLARLYDLGEPEEYDELREAIVSSAEDRASFPDISSRRVQRKHLENQVDWFFEVFEMTGVVTRRDAEREERDWGPPHIVGGFLELSAYGIALVQRWLPTLGWVAPVVPRFDVTAGDAPEDVVRALAAVLEASGPVFMLEALDTLGNDALQQALLDRLWRVDDDGALEVLRTIGRHHVSKPVAKAARTVAIKHQSRRAGL